MRWNGEDKSNSLKQKPNPRKVFLDDFELDIEHMGLIFGAICLQSHGFDRIIHEKLFGETKTSFGENRPNVTP